MNLVMRGWRHLSSTDGIGTMTNCCWHVPVEENKYIGVDQCMNRCSCDFDSMNYTNVTRTGILHRYIMCANMNFPLSSWRRFNVPQTHYRSYRGTGFYRSYDW